MESLMRIKHTKPLPLYIKMLIDGYTYKPTKIIYDSNNTWEQTAQNLKADLESYNPEYFILHGSDYYLNYNDLERMVQTLDGPDDIFACGVQPMTINGLRACRLNESVDCIGRIVAMKYRGYEMLWAKGEVSSINHHGRLTEQQYYTMYEATKQGMINVVDTTARMFYLNQDLKYFKDFIYR